VAREDGAMQPPWHFTTWLELLDHWQSLIAGVLAFVAAVIVVGFSELFAGRQRRREIAAIRASLAVEISEFIEWMTETHRVLTGLTTPQMRSNLTKFELPRPTVYPATADRIGAFGTTTGGGRVQFLHKFRTHQPRCEGCFQRLLGP
jgi:hypothetical protein